MTEDQLNQLQQVNTQVNEIPYSALPGPTEGGDVWKDTPDGGTWECRDYVLLKSEKLQALGWDPCLMSVILCWAETGEYHAVLGIADETTNETTILDSRFDSIYPMIKPPALYKWDRRQIAGSSEFMPVTNLA